MVVSEPGTEYRGSRFDWNGFVKQVTLDGRHSFCVPESLTPGKGTGGCGLCGEFGIDEALGYEEAPIGGYFTKIGVGLLQKTGAGPYEFSGQYSVVPALSRVGRTGDSAEFMVCAPDCGGYAYEYRKDISLRENHLIISYFLKNVGTRAIRTTEYCHNFMGIDGLKVNGEYSLKLPFPAPISMEAVVGEFRESNGVITWPDTVMQRDFYCIIPDCRSNDTYSWELYNSRAGAGVRAAGDFQVYRFALWGFRHVISPETFIRLELEPGQSKTWARDYEFYEQR